MPADWQQRRWIPAFAGMTSKGAYAGMTAFAGMTIECAFARATIESLFPGMTGKSRSELRFHQYTSRA